MRQCLTSHAGIKFALHHLWKWGFKYCNILDCKLSGVWLLNIMAYLPWGDENCWWYCCTWEVQIIYGIKQVMYHVTAQQLWWLLVKTTNIYDLQANECLYLKRINRICSKGCLFGWAYVVPALLVIKNCAIGISAVNFMLSARFPNTLTLVTSCVTQSSYESKDLMLMNKPSLGEELVTCLICLFQIQTYDSQDLMLMHKLPLGDELVTWSICLFQIQTLIAKTEC